MRQRREKVNYNMAAASCDIIVVFYHLETVCCNMAADSIDFSCKLTSLYHDSLLQHYSVLNLTVLSVSSNMAAHEMSPITWRWYKCISSKNSTIYNYILGQKQIVSVTKKNP